MKDIPPQRPNMSGDSTNSLENGIERARGAPVNILDENVPVVTICARSERWWNKDAKERVRFWSGQIGGKMQAWK